MLMREVAFWKLEQEASAAISGSDVHGKLKFESGVHRVQRVPITEKSGHVHTSAVFVAILPQATEVDLQLKNDDLRIDAYRDQVGNMQILLTVLLESPIFQLVLWFLYKMKLVSPPSVREQFHSNFNVFRVSGGSSDRDPC